MTVSPMDMEGSQEFRDYRDKNKKTVYILGALIGVLVILTITFIALYASKDSCDDSSNKSKNMNSANGGNAGKIPTTSAVTKAATTTPSVATPAATTTPSVATPAATTTPSVATPAATTTPSVATPAATTTPSVATPAATTTPSVATPAISDDEAKQLLASVLNTTDPESNTTLDTLDDGKVKVVLQVADAAQLSQFVKKISEGRLITALNSMSKNYLKDVLGKMEVDDLKIVLNDTRNTEVISTLKSMTKDELGKALKSLPEEDVKKWTIALTGCQTEACKKTSFIAKYILDKMDRDVKPCDDFAQFACGTFLKTAKIPADKTAVGTFDNAAIDNIKHFQEILESHQSNHQSNISFEHKMKMFYNSCLDEDVMENHGLVDYTEDLRKQWPTLNSDWNESSFKLQDLAEIYTDLSTAVLFIFYKKADNTIEVPKYMIEIDHPHFMLDKKTLSDKRGSPNVLAYENYYKEFATALGAGTNTVEQDAKDVIDMYRDLSGISIGESDERNATLITNPTTLGQMKTDYPYLDWVKVFQSILSITKVDIDSTQKINVRDTNYFTRLGAILTNPNNSRTVQNMFGFAQARYRVARATKEMRNVELNFRKVRIGVKQELPREMYCSMLVDKVYNIGMAKLVSETRFPQAAQTFMNDLIENLRNAYTESFKDVSWMGNETKEEALAKVKAVEALVGVQKTDFDYSDIDEFYWKYQAGGDLIPDYLQNNEVKISQDWSQINQVVDRTKWLTSMTTVNAYNVQERNELVFPLGILQLPFYDHDRPSYMNYGGIGMVIGHEFGHGYDTNGRNFDRKGRFVDWWTSEDSAEYDKKAQCFVDQYSNYTMDIDNHKYPLDGMMTKTENIADYLGIHESFKAYRVYADNNEIKDWPLPGISLTKDQLFFVAFAQNWCMEATNETKIALLNSDTHTYSNYRIIGALQNDNDFHDAYQCAKGSYMNPDKQCNLW